MIGPICLFVILMFLFLFYYQGCSNYVRLYMYLASDAIDVVITGLAKQSRPRSDCIREQQCMYFRDNIIQKHRGNCFKKSMSIINERKPNAQKNTRCKSGC